MIRIERYKDGKKFFGFEYYKYDKFIVYLLFLLVNINGDIWIVDNYDCYVFVYNDEGDELCFYDGFKKGF